MEIECSRCSKRVKETPWECRGSTFRACPKSQSESKLSFRRKSHLDSLALRRYATRNGETLIPAFRALRRGSIRGISAEPEWALVMARYTSFSDISKAARERAIRFPRGALKSPSAPSACLFAIYQATRDAMAFVPLRVHSAGYRAYPSMSANDFSSERREIYNVR